MQKLTFSDSFPVHFLSPCNCRPIRSELQTTPISLLNLHKFVLVLCLTHFELILNGSTSMKSATLRPARLPWISHPVKKGRKKGGREGQEKKKVEQRRNGINDRAEAFCFIWSYQFVSNPIHYQVAS